MRPFGIRDKVGYACGEFANHLFFLFISSFLMLFYTDVLDIRPQFIGLIFLLSRILDAFTDIAMGRILDRFLSDVEDGKYHFWIKHIALPVVFAGILLFNTGIKSLPLALRLLYVFFTYTLWGSIFFTAINIPYGSMATVITNDTAERSSLSVFRTMGEAVASCVVYLFVPLLIYRETGRELVLLEDRFLHIAAVFAVLAFFAYMACYRLTKERVRLPAKERNDEMPVDILFRSIVLNKALITFIPVSILFFLSMLFVVSFNTYLFAEFFHSRNALALAGILSVVSSFVLAPFIKKIAVRFGKKNSSVVALLFASAMYFVLFFLHTDRITLFIAGVFVANCGVNYFSLILWAFISDIIDYHEVLTYDRNDATIYAVYSFAKKLGQALAGALGGFLLFLIGYQSSVKGIAKEIAPDIYRAATLVPALSFLCIALLIALFYPLSMSKVGENKEELERRRAYQKELANRNKSAASLDSF